MKPAPFEYHRARDVGEAVRLLAEADGEAKLLAGGQSLVPVLALRMSRPALLVDVNRIPGLSGIRAIDAETIEVGALTRHSALIAQQSHPLLAAAAQWIGHAAIRSRGTAGGSIAHADPSAELPVVAVALGATIEIVGVHGARWIPAEDFFTGPLDTDLRDDEMVTSVRFPVPRRWGFAELSRRHGDFGLVTVVAAEVDGEIRIAIGGVAGTPHRATDSEAVLAAGSLTAHAIAEAAASAAEGVHVADDLHATASYRRAMTREFTRRALAQMADDLVRRTA